VSYVCWKNKTTFKKKTKTFSFSRTAVTATSMVRPTTHSLIEGRLLKLTAISDIGVLNIVVDGLNHTTKPI
jgi:hypothetical protein